MFNVLCIGTKSALSAYVKLNQEIREAAVDNAIGGVEFDVALQEVLEDPAKKTWHSKIS